MELISSPSDFFQQVLHEVIARHDVELREVTESYLVNLLTEQTVARVDDEPLMLKLAQAELAEPLTRVRLLKETGDTALYTCGFFAESLSRRQLSVEYYMDLGAAAYRQLVHAERLVGELFRGVFHELAARFPSLVAVLIEARSHFAMSRPVSVIELYEQWRKTRSEHLARRLRAAGFLLPNNDENN
jgi:hypothetical protein